MLCLRDPVNSCVGSIEVLEGYPRDQPVICISVRQQKHYSIFCKKIQSLTSIVCDINDKTLARHQTKTAFITHTGT